MVQKSSIEAYKEIFWDIFVIMIYVHHLDLLGYFSFINNLDLVSYLNS